MARDYTKIRAWQLSNELALMVYKATKAFPKSEIWGLTSQMRRAAVSVPANIVEGSARKNQGEYIHFLYIARSSLAELEYFIGFSKDLEYLACQEQQKLWEKCQESMMTLQGLISTLKSPVSNVRSLKSNI